MAIFNKKTNSDKSDDGKEKAVKDTVKGGAVKDMYKDDKAKKEVKKSRKDSSAFKVLLKPLVTEKAANLGAENKYVFEIAIDSNKSEVIKSIENVYGVKPEKVNVVNMIGKKVRRGMVQGRRKNWKKAIVTLPKGKTIDIYEGI